MVLVYFDVLLVYSLDVRQSNKLHCSLTTIYLIYDSWSSWRHPHLQKQIFTFEDVSCAALAISVVLFNPSNA